MTSASAVHQLAATSWGLGFYQRNVLWLASLAAGGLWVWAQRGRRPGLPRLAAALPLLVLNLLAPLLFDGDTEVITVISVFISTAAITNMKLLSWIMDRGSLVHPLTRAQFMAVYALPITPAEVPPPAGSADASGGGAEPEAADTQGKRRGGRVAEVRTTGTHFRHFLRKVAALAGIVYVLNTFGELPHILQVLVQGFSQYLSLSLSMDAMAALVGATTGLAVAPHFDNPYLSTSAANFWNERWNLTVSNVLRAAVYDPIMDGRLVRRAGQAAPFSRTRRMLGVFLVFLVSGIMHEVLFWYFAGCFTPRLMWLSYFVLWGVILLVENGGKKALRKQGYQVPTIVARILTVTLVNVMVAALWWPPVVELGLPQKATRHAVEGWRDFQKGVLGRWQE